MQNFTLVHVLDVLYIYTFGNIFLSVFKNFTLKTRRFKKNWRNFILQQHDTKYKGEAIILLWTSKVSEGKRGNSFHLLVLMFFYHIFEN